MKWFYISSLLVLINATTLVAKTPFVDQEQIPSGTRVALLIGNSRYDGFQLSGATQSLDEIEKALQQQDFYVQRRENQNQQEMKAALEEFVRTVPTNGVAVVYYHGLAAHVSRQNKWYNLLRPVGEKIESDNDYRTRGIDVQEMMKSLQQRSGSRVNLIFLDACRESPIVPEKGEVFGGLRQFDLPSNSAAIFAAESGKTLTSPKQDVASGFAKAIARHIGKLDGSVAQTFQSVASESGEPWFHATIESGIGLRSKLPMIRRLEEGKQPGEGYVNSVGMTFRWCPQGSFTMGSTDSDTSATNDRKPVQVTLSRGFWMGEHEVTQREYSDVMKKNAPGGFTTHKNAPYWGITEAKSVSDFCGKLNELERKTGTLPEGWEYACPTEAEWEYACRAGSSSAYCFGDSPEQLGRYGNFADNSLWQSNPNYYWARVAFDDGVGESLASVGSYLPNAWGLRDMHGNVAEIVADHLLPGLPGGVDPLVKVEKDGKTQIRGGAWCSVALYCESSFRNAPPGRDKHNFVGFRVALKKVK